MFGKGLNNRIKTNYQKTRIKLNYGSAQYTSQDYLLLAAAECPRGKLLLIEISQTLEHFDEIDPCFS